MAASASDFFAEHLKSYDSLIRRAVPDYDEMLVRLELYLPPGCARILELGSGTGNFSLRLAAAYPQAELLTVDAAEEMIALTRSRLAAAAPRLNFETLAARFEDLDLPAQSFDLIASAISLHHVRDKAALFAEMNGLLEPGGYFIFADQMAAGGERTGDTNWQRWLEFCRSEPACTQAEIDGLLEHAEAHDHYAPVYEQMRQLEAAGFVELDCVWRNWMWGIVVGRRSGE